MKDLVLILSLFFTLGVGGAEESENHKQVHKFLVRQNDLIVDSKHEEALAMRSENYHQITIGEDGNKVEIRKTKEEMLKAILEMEKRWDQIELKSTINAISELPDGSLLATCTDHSKFKLDGELKEITTKITRRFTRIDGVLRLEREDYRPSEGIQMDKNAEQAVDPSRSSAPLLKTESSARGSDD
ncbi:hypothetical protein [Haloferula sp.]|uniref:hypothetical protein n=1 Tax=Haloferula sp. TaxID=2497595 RepID=UPI00329CF72D